MCFTTQHHLRGHTCRWFTVRCSAQEGAQAQCQAMQIPNGSNIENILNAACSNKPFMRVWGEVRLFWLWALILPLGFCIKAFFFGLLLCSTILRVSPGGGGGEDGGGGCGGSGGFGEGADGRCTGGLNSVLGGLLSFTALVSISANIGAMFIKCRLPLCWCWAIWVPWAPVCPKCPIGPQ